MTITREPLYDDAPGGRTTSLVRHTVALLASIGRAVRLMAESLGFLPGVFLRRRGRAALMKQFYSTGIPIVKQLAENLGKTEAEIRKMISAGQVSFRMVSDAFKTMTDEGGKFGNMMEKQSHTITGHVNVIKGLIQNMMNEIGKDMEGPIEKVLAGVEGAVKNYEKYGKTIGAVIGALGLARAAQVVYAASVKATGLAEAGLTITLGKNTASQYANIAATHGAKTAQQALNKAILANPYVLLATAVLSLTAGLLAYKRANDFALQSQKRLNKSAAEAASEATKEQTELNKLTAKLEGAEKGTSEYNDAKNELISKFGKYYSGLKDELEKVDGLSTAYEILTEKIRESANARAYASFVEKQEEEQNKKLNDLYGELLERLENKYGKGSVEAFSTLGEIQRQIVENGGLDEEMKALVDGLMTYSKTAVDKWEIETFGTMGSAVEQMNEWFANLFQKSGTEIVDELIELGSQYDAFSEKAKEAFSGGAEKTEMQKFLDGLTEADLTNLLDQMEEFKRLIKETEGTHNFSFTVGGQTMDAIGGFTIGGSDSKRFRMLEALTTTTRDSKKSTRETQEQKDREEAKAQAEAAAQEAAKRIRARQAVEKAEEALDKAQYDARAQAQKALLDLREDGIAKELALADYEKERQLHAIEEQKKAYIERLKDLERARWKAANPDTKGEWDDKSFKLTADQQKFIDEMYGPNGIMAQNANSAAAVAIKKSVDKQLEEYGEYYQKRDVLARQHNDKIAEEEKRLTEITDAEERRRLEIVIERMRQQRDVELAQADLDYVSEYGGRGQRRDATRKLWEARLAGASEGMRAGIEKQMRVALSEIDVEEFKDAISWDVVFGNLSLQGTKAIQTMMEKVGQFTEANRKNLGIDEIRDLEEAIASMADEIASRDPFVALKMSIQSLGVLKDSIPALVEAYKAALEEVRNENTQYAIEVDYLSGLREQGLITEGEYTQRLTDAQGRLDFAQEKLVESSKALNSAQNSIVRTTQVLIGSINTLRGKFRDTATGLADMVGIFDDDLANAINEAISLFSELGDIVMEITETLVQDGSDLITGLQDTVSNTSEAVERTAKATSAAISAAETASVVLLVIKAVITALTAVFKIIKANEQAQLNAANAARKYATALEKLNDAARLDSLQNAFGSDSYKQFKALNTQLGEAGKKMQELAYGGGKFVADMRSGWQKFWGTGKNNIVEASIADFYDSTGRLDGEKLGAWYSAYGEYLDEETKQLVDDLLGQYDRFEESMEGMADYLRGLFGDIASDVAGAMVDSFVESGDALADLTELSKDFGKSMAKSVVTSMLMETVFTKKAQDTLKNLLLGGNVAGAVDFYNRLLDEASQQAPAITEFLRSLNIEDITSDRQAATRSSLGASQDSIDESNGRLTAIQGHTYELNENTRAIREQNASLVSTSSAILEYIQGIHSHTGIMVAVLNDMREISSYIRSGMNTIVDKGVRMM